MISLLQQIDLTRVPAHIAIIMDGNGRWAKARGEVRTYGHEHGVESVRRVLKAANKVGVKVLTLYTFSEENWSRPQEEVHALMQLLVNSLLSEEEELMENDIRLRVMGEIDLLPRETQEILNQVLEHTSTNRGAQLVLALNYSGRTEIVRATNRLLKRGVSIIEEADFVKELYMGGSVSDPDLMIRTGGEQRISNFLLWQMAYTEFYFTPTYWPDFGEEEFYQAILEYQSRERRYGKTGEQIGQHQE